LATEDVRIVCIILGIYNVFSDLTIIFDVSFNPRAQQAQINITQIRDPKSSKFFLFCKSFSSLQGAISYALQNHSRGNLPSESILEI
jgi:hypothetical protein